MIQIHTDYTIFPERRVASVNNSGTTPVIIKQQEAEDNRMASLTKNQNRTIIP